VTDLVRAFLIPGSKWFCTLGLTAGVLLLWMPRGAKRWGRLSLTALAGAYWMMSIPAVATRIASAGYGDGSAMSDTHAGPAADAIVVLGSGVWTYSANGLQVTVPVEQSALNAFEAARLYKLSPVPVVVSGGVVDPFTRSEPESEILRNLLVRAGVPENAIVPESTSRTTHEQALNVARLFVAHNWKRGALIAAPVHMLRALRVFRVQGIDAVPFPARYRSDNQRQPLAWWLPSSEAADISEVAMYDYLGWVYYWGRGWM